MQFSRIFTAICIALLITGSAYGAEKSGQFSISPMVGSFTFGNIFRSYSRTSTVNEIKASYNLTDYIGLESNFAYAQTRRSNNHQSFFKYGGDVLFNLLPGGDFVPYLALGAGGFNFMESNRGVTTAAQSYVGGGGGIKYSLNKNVALRMDGRVNYVITETDYKQIELLVGLQIPFGGSKPATRSVENKTGEDLQQPELSSTGTASSDTRPTNSPSVRVTMPLEAGVSVTIPPLPAQNVTVTVKSAGALTDETAKPHVLPSSSTAPVASSVAPVVAASPVRKTLLKNIIIGRDVIAILADGPLTGYKSIHLSGPERLSIDLPSTAYALSKKLMPVNRMGVSTIRVGSYPDSVRIVLDTSKKQFPTYRIETRDNSLRIHFASKPAKKVPVKRASGTKK